MTFINTVNDNDKVLGETKVPKLNRDNIRKGLGRVQEIEHAEAGIAGAEHRPPNICSA